MNTKTNKNSNRTSRTARTTNKTSGKAARLAKVLNKRDRELFNYQPTKVGAIKFGTASKAALYMLQKTKLSQSEIARRCGVSQPCVCQLAATIKR